MSDLPYRIIGKPQVGGVLVVADHASNRVPDGIDLAIAPALLNQHIAWDIGTMAVAELLAARPGHAAFVATVSRLVCDFNREEQAPGLVPLDSDGHAIPGNHGVDRDQRLAQFHRPYHAALERVLADMQPRLILSLHSFTPHLASRPEEQRPWQAGVLYNQDDRGARAALPLLQADALVVGDQQPYSGRDLNYTMNRHAEMQGRLYLGVELRQDQISDASGQAEWAERLARIISQI